MRLLALLLILIATPALAQMQPSHGLAMHGAPQLPSNFKHYNYAAPNALKGGTLRQGQIGSFDSLNPFSIRGNAARNIRERVFESLLDRHYDEPFALYGLLAESLTTAPDRSSATFKLRREAKFADGKPLTAADVAFYPALAIRAAGATSHAGTGGATCRGRGRAVDQGAANGHWRRDHGLREPGVWRGGGG